MEHCRVDRLDRQRLAPSWEFGFNMPMPEIMESRDRIAKWEMEGVSRRSLFVRFFELMLYIFALSAHAQTSGIIREVYQISLGGSLQSLTNASIFPNKPTSTEIVTNLFEAPSNIMDNYGQRMRGFVYPPETGDYLFWIACDDQGLLYLSTDESPAHKRPIASVSSWTNPREWFKETNQQSQWIRLEAGRRYYIEALQSEGGGGDCLAVGWQWPSLMQDMPISAKYLSPIEVAAAAPAIAVQPQDVTVLEGNEVVLFVRPSSLDPLQYQWQQNSNNIAGATNSVLTLPLVFSEMNGSWFRCVLRNNFGTVESRDALITVNPDLIPPIFTKVSTIANTNIVITFNEKLAYQSVTNLSNYLLLPEVKISKAELSTNQTQIILSTEKMDYGVTYFLTLNNISDRANPGNIITPDTTTHFISYEYTPVDIGALASASSVHVQKDGFDIKAQGGDIGGLMDQFQFNYQTRKGDFDVKVRIQNLSFSDLWAKAGIMARETLDARTRFAATLATPSYAGSYFAYRSSTTTASTAGYAPVNYPDTWLRLKRFGNTFSGYASLDGNGWSPLGSVVISLPENVFLGIAVCSKNTNAPVVAEIRDYGLVTSPGTQGAMPLVEPPGPSNRRSGIVISEIMYHPATSLDNLETEFIEVFNSNPFFEDISRYRIGGEVDYTFPQGTVLEGGAYLVVARKPEDVEKKYGIKGVLGPYKNKLSNNSGMLVLYNQLDAIIFETTYQSTVPWPVSPDGAGHSLILKAPSYGEKSVKSWSASAFIGGSPQRQEALNPDLLKRIRINEILVTPGDGQISFIELINLSNETVSLGGCYLTDDTWTNRYVVPTGVQIPAKGYYFIRDVAIRGLLNPLGGALWMVDPSQKFVIDAIKYPVQEPFLPWGRYPDSSEQFYRMEYDTPGTANGPILLSDVVINEIMYRPISGNDNDQYIELYNRSAETVDLGGWKVMDGINFQFPAGTLLKPDDYLVVAKNRERFLSRYPKVNPAQVCGDFEGVLSGAGERIVLARPLQEDSFSGTPTHYIEVDEVDYGTGDSWGKWANGGGSSLELRNPNCNNRLAGNWTHSDETQKAPWTSIQFTGRLDLGNSQYGPNSLQLFLLDAGECVVDNLEAFHAGQTNLIINGSFDEVKTNWFFQGNHERSRIESGIGLENSKALHIRATSRGDTGANRIRIPLGTTMRANSNATLRAQARWLKGTPEILIRTRGNFLECAGTMTVPTDLGTPGAQNSQFVPASAPSIYDVGHSPILPAANQSVVITARVEDMQGIESVSLLYRIDPSTNYSRLLMRDDGTYGDELSNDGLYSVQIPGRASNTVVAFYIEAVNKASPATTQCYPSSAPANQCLIRFGDMPQKGTLGIYRLWMTKATLDRWSSREKLSNEPMDCTFVYNNTRVIYNMGARYSGSPWHSPGYNSPIGGNCDYLLTFNKDDRFLGDTEINLLQPGNGGGDGTGQGEQTAYWMAAQLGEPFCYRRYLTLYVNGVKRGAIFEDAQQPNPDFVEQWYPGREDGDLHKIAVWFEFDDAASSFGGVGAELGVYLSEGKKKLARYRWNFPRRAVKDSASNYTNLFSLVDAVNTTATSNAYTSTIESAVDIDNWARVLLVEKLVGNNDSYGNGGGQNMYTYKPVGAPWNLLIWDIDFAFQSQPATSDLFSFSDAPVSKIFKHPPFLRAYWRAIKDAYTGPLQSTNIEPLLNAKYAAFQANGLSVSSPSSIKTFVTARRNYVQTQLSKANYAFAITSNGGRAFSASSNYVNLLGTAPIDVLFLRISGNSYIPTWTSVSNWLVRLPLSQGANTFFIEGLDRNGVPLNGSQSSIQITYTGSSTSLTPKIVINEWMASNGSTILNPLTQQYDDWLELYNTSEYIVSLSGWRLATSLSVPSYVFPSGTFLNANQHLLVWADGTGVAKSGQPLHANFKLNRDGEEIWLWANDGKLMDRVVFGSQKSDMSQGRYPDGSSEPFVFMDQPTPGMPNLAPMNGNGVKEARFSGTWIDSSGQFNMLWDMPAAGLRSRVQFKNKLTDLQWQELTGDYVIEGSSLRLVDKTSGIGERYYRLIIE